MQCNDSRISCGGLLSNNVDTFSIGSQLMLVPVSSMSKFDFLPRYGHSLSIRQSVRHSSTLVQRRPPRIHLCYRANIVLEFVRHIRQRIDACISVSRCRSHNLMLSETLPAVLLRKKSRCALSIEFIDAISSSLRIFVADSFSFLWMSLKRRFFLKSQHWICFFDLVQITFIE